MCLITCMACMGNLRARALQRGLGGGSVRVYMYIYENATTFSKNWVGLEALNICTVSSGS